MIEIKNETKKKIFLGFYSWIYTFFGPYTFQAYQMYHLLSGSSRMKIKNCPLDIITASDSSDDKSNVFVPPWTMSDCHLCFFFT